MNSELAAKGRRIGQQAEVSSRRAPVWWLIFQQEFAELWLGGRALNLLILFSVLLSITAFLLATNADLSLTPPPLAEEILVQAAITFGLFIGLIIAAETVSGERERATLEGLLLTPSSRRQIVAGKFLAALTPWPAAMLLTVPYMITLAQGDPALLPALIWGGLTGTILAAAFTALGLLVSIWSNSSRISLFVSILLYLTCLLPSQLPGQVQATPALIVVQAVDPVEAMNQFLNRVIVNSLPQVGIGSNPGAEDLTWLYLGGVVAVSALIIGLLFVVVAPRLHLEGEGAGFIRSITKRMEASR